jgi:hypothetical protein
VQRLVDAQARRPGPPRLRPPGAGRPGQRQLLQRAGARGDNLGSITAALMRLLERWGAAALQAAITEALARDVPHPNAVRLALERARAASGEPPPVALVLPEHVAKRDAPVRTHDLRSYDRQPDQQAEHPQTHRRAPMNDTATPAAAARAGRRLRLHGLIEHWAEVMAQPEQARWVAQMLTWEAAERSRRSLERRLREAHIGRFKPLADFDWAWPKQIDRAPSKN